MWAMSPSGREGWGQEPIQRDAPPLSGSLPPLPRLVREAGLLGDDREEAGGGAPRPVEAGLPLAHGLLAGAQLRRHLLLAEPQVATERPHALRFPFALAWVAAPTRRVIL